MSSFFEGKIMNVSQGQSIYGKGSKDRTKAKMKRKNV